MTGLKRRAGTRGAGYRLFLLFPFVTLKISGDVAANAFAPGVDGAGREVECDLRAYAHPRSIVDRETTNHWCSSTA